MLFSVEGYIKQGEYKNMILHKYLRNDKLLNFRSVASALGLTIWEVSNMSEQQHTCVISPPWSLFTPSAPFLVHVQHISGYKGRWMTTGQSVAFQISVFSFNSTIKQQRVLSDSSFNYFSMKTSLLQVCPKICILLCSDQEHHLAKFKA